MTLQEKLNYLKEIHPEIYEVLCNNVPNLVDRPSSPSKEDLEEYNFWIYSLDENEAELLFHLLDD